MTGRKERAFGSPTNAEAGRASSLCSLFAAMRTFRAVGRITEPTGNTSAKPSGPTLGAPARCQTQYRRSLRSRSRSSDHTILRARAQRSGAHSKDMSSRNGYGHSGRGTSRRALRFGIFRPIVLRDPPRYLKFASPFDTLLASSSKDIAQFLRVSRRGVVEMVRRPSSESAWVTVGAAARAIGVHHSYVRMLVDTGRLRAKRTSFGIRLIDRAAVERFARERARRLAGT